MTDADTTVDDLHQQFSRMTLRPRPAAMWKELDARCRAGDLPKVYQEAFVVKAADVIERKDRAILALEFKMHVLKERLEALET